MKNNTKSQIVITMCSIDDAWRFTQRLKSFCDKASEGGDAEMLIRAGDEKIHECGFVAHDLHVLSIDHIISQEESGDLTQEIDNHLSTFNRKYTLVT